MIGLGKTKRATNADIKRLRVCIHCSHGYFVDTVHNCTPLGVRIVEHIQVAVYTPWHPAKPRKKDVVQRRKCGVCGKRCGVRHTCSDVCKIRWQSSWYDNSKLCFISIEEAEARLEKIYAKKKS